jgi:hypothetical protein
MMVFQWPCGTWSINRCPRGQRPRVERSLYERANGYNYNAVKIFMPAGSKQPVMDHPLTEEEWARERATVIDEKVVEELPAPDK